MPFELACSIPDLNPIENLWPILGQNRKPANQVLFDRQEKNRNRSLLRTWLKSCPEDLIIDAKGFCNKEVLMSVACRETSKKQKILFFV
jgi:transposase